jgi:hypothetical protein
MNYQSTKKGKYDFPFFFIFNDLLVIENGSTSLCCGNSELIRVSLNTVFGHSWIFTGCNDLPAATRPQANKTLNPQMNTDKNCIVRQ